MKRIVLSLLIAHLISSVAFAGFAGSGFSGPPYVHGTLTDGKWCTYSSASGIVCNSDEPAGTGTVSGPAVATEDNIVVWGADNATLKDSGHALSEYAPLVSPSFTTPTLGVAAATTLDTGQGAYELYAMDQNVRTSDNVTFGTVTADEFVSSAADNTRGVTVPNTADPTGANLAAGKGWFNTTSNLLKFRNADNDATLEIFTATSTNTGNYYTTGTLNAGQKTVAKTDNVTLSGAEVYGTWIEAGAGADNITLPAVATNMSVCVMATDNVQKRIIPNGSDAIIYMDGTDFGNGHFALSVAAGATAPNGEFLCLKGSATANKWRVTGRGTTAWTDGGAP